MYVFSNNGSENENSGIKIITLARGHISTQDKLVREHASTQGTLAGEHVSMQGKLAREHVSMQDTLAREHVSTQSTLARDHISTQGTLASEHVFSTQGMQFNRLFNSPSHFWIILPRLKISSFQIKKLFFFSVVFSLNICHFVFRENFYNIIIEVL